MQADHGLHLDDARGDLDRTRRASGKLTGREIVDCEHGLR
jgi:hypothetical protein